MREIIARIKTNRILAKDTVKMVLDLWREEELRPGQFVDIMIPGLFLRRPISICDVEGTEITIIYKIVGKGTEELSLMEEGEELNLLIGLGNGYDLEAAGDTPLLIGGGVGVPPMYYLAKVLASKGITPKVILGFNVAEEAFYVDEFKALGCDTEITTLDGSLGIKGFVTDAIGDDAYSYYYACGPEPMLKAIHDKLEIAGEMSFETRMGCGFGACMGCSCKTQEGSKRLCKEGPVLKKEEILWQD